MAANDELTVGGANRGRRQWKEGGRFVFGAESGCWKRQFPPRWTCCGTESFTELVAAEMDPVLNLEVRVLLHRTDVQQQHVCKQEMVLKQEDSGLDQEEPEPLNIKEEQDEQNQTPTDEPEKPNKCQMDVFLDTRLIKQENISRPIKEEEKNPRCSRAEKQLEMNQETKAVILTSANEKRDQSDSEPNRNRLRRTSSEADTSPDSESRSNTESDRKPLQCSHCGKTFVCRAKLMAHTRVHTGEKPFVCKMCGKRFRTNDCLKRHVLIHTGEKPAICEICGKRFSRSCYLSIHTRTHTGEKPYECEVCGKSFPSNSALRSHTSVHTAERPHVCEDCGKRFGRKGTLDKHRRTHTGEKPYFCETCGKLFRDNYTLSQHIKIHTT
ncbi:zinc finger protein 32-like [Poecilia reticulata]|uniref:Zinc finger protein 32-like n=1 Tax=Poecilia reticulata TaxID=8081 RepID=A0A3P9PS66_POERE|nr:PREDICTED: zinc finger protein 32-like [Poecilia reticulata]